MANIKKFEQPIRVGSLASDPASPENGQIYYNTTSNVLRQYINGAWANVTSGSVSLTGQSLSEFNIIVGNSSNASAAVDTSASGDIQVSSSGGLTIKSGVIVNADVNASAAIDYSKLAALSTNKVLQSNGSGFVSASSVTSTELGYLSGVTSSIQTQINSIAEGLKPKAAVRAATTVAGTLASSFADTSVIDGVTLATGDRILIKDQAAPAQNGIYVVQASGAPVRATDFDATTPTNEIEGAYVAAQEGTSNAGKLFVQYGTVTTIGTDAINFTFFNSVSGLVGGDGITISGSNVAVDHDGQGLQFTTNQLALELDGSTLSKSASGVKVADGGIANTQVAAAAAIALDKLAATTASRALQSDASGFVSASSVTSTELGYLSGVTSAVQTQLGGKASLALDNLASVAINTSLISDTNNTDDLGSSGVNWKDVHAKSLRSSTDLLVQANGGSNNLSEVANIVKRSKDGTNFIEQEYLDSLTLLDNQSSAVAISAFTFAFASHMGVEIVYTIKEATSNLARIGKLNVVSTGGTPSITDEGNETGDPGIRFSAAINGSNVEISYTSTSTGNVRTMRADVKRFRA